MSYSRDDFSKDLDKIISDSLGCINCKKIGDWACKTRMHNISDIDTDVDDWLIELGAMSMGSEFELSESELREYIFRATENKDERF